MDQLFKQVIRLFQGKLFQGKLFRNKLYRRSLVTAAFISLLLILINYETLFAPEPPNYGATARQTVAKEFRAAWIASVANINWPSKPGLSVKQQQAEAITLLNAIEKANMNAVILQVRPQADALYQSELEPWSYYLTGEQGKAPEPFYDPLTFWVEEAHKRGLELHAWVNPYRAHHIKGGEVSDSSIVNTHADLVVALESGYYWMDPSNPKTAAHSLKVIKDIVARYDIDGIHYDDYFYPYPSYNKGKSFPDQVNYQAYLTQGGKLSASDWRRDHVNQFVKQLYQEIKTLKPHVKVGVSPFGIWRPGYPETIQGMDQYEVLYADAKLWLNQGWLDYFTPQLYWNVNRIPQSFPMLLSWWQDENTQSRHLWPGLSSNKANTHAGADEVMNQILISRAMLKQQAGQVFWNIKTVQDNPEFAETLAKTVYYNKAIVPASPWLDNKPPAVPKVEYTFTPKHLEVSWQPQGEEPAFKWIVYYNYGEKWRYKLLKAGARKVHLPVRTKTVTSSKYPVEIAVVAVDRTGLESERVNIQLEEIAQPVAN